MLCVSQQIIFEFMNCFYSCSHKHYYGRHVCETTCYLFWQWWWIWTMCVLSVSCIVLNRDLLVPHNGRNMPRNNTARWNPKYLTLFKQINAYIKKGYTTGGYALPVCMQTQAVLYGVMTVMAGAVYVWHQHMISEFHVFKDWFEEISFF